MNVMSALRRLEHLTKRMSSTFAFRALRWAWRRPLLIPLANAVPSLVWQACLVVRIRLKRYLPLAVRDMLFRYVLPRSTTLVGNRRYIRAPLDRKSFTDELERRGVRYAVLRWFERFPEWPAGEDMDILIDPSDVAKTSDLFQLRPNGIPVDLFTTDGSKNLSYAGVSYLPQAFAARLLMRVNVGRAGCRVPCAEDHFFSLAYHAVYHKCEISGLPSRSGYFAQVPGEHDYQQILRSLAEKIGVKTALTIEDLHELMQARGIAPGFDTLRKLAARMPNLMCLLPAEACDRRGGELVAIVLRDWAIERGFPAPFKGEIEARLKFEILAEIPIDSAARTRALTEMRGADWGAGPNPRSGGGPAVLFLCFDYHPEPPAPWTRSMHPFVKNENVIRAKNHLRKYAHARTLFREHANPVHTADDEVEALHYAEIVSPELAARARRQIEEIRDRYATRYPVRALLSSFRRRAKVELIELRGRLAVKKTFRPAARDYFVREIEFIQSLQGQCSWLPEIIEVGECYFVMPYYTNVLATMSKRESRRLLRRRAKEIVDIMRIVYDCGYALMDFNPSNVIVEPGGRLILVDFEYVHRYRDRPASFLQSFDIAGVPALENGELADGATEQSMPYSIAWRPLLGPISRVNPPDR